MSIRFSLLKIVLLLWFLGAACFITFQLTGSSVDQNGFVHEPFALIPIGWLFIITGCIVGVIHVLRTGVKQVSGRRK